MSTKDSDLFHHQDILLVNRGGTDYQVLVEKVLDVVNDNDILIVNRNSVDYKVEAKGFKDYIDGNTSEVQDSDFFLLNQLNRDYKVNASRLKDYLKPSIPDFKVKLVRAEHKCISNATPGMDKYGGTLYVQPEVEWLDPQGSYSLKFNAKSVEYLKPDGTWKTADYNSSRGYYAKLYKFDPQQNLDPYHEPVFIVRASYELYNGSTKVSDGVTEEFSIEAGPSWNDTGDTFEVLAQKIWDDIELFIYEGDGRKKYRIHVDHTHFVHPMKECMRPAMPTVRGMDSGYTSKWMGWTQGLTMGGTNLYNGTTVVWQAKCTCKSQYNPAPGGFDKWRDVPPINDEIIEFRVSFNDAVNDLDKSKIKIEIGGKYGHDKAETAPHFFPKPQN